MSARSRRRRDVRLARERDRRDVDRVPPGERVPIGEWTEARRCALVMVRKALGWPVVARLELAEHLIEQGITERDLVLLGIGQAVRSWVADTVTTATATATATERLLS